MGAAFLHSPRLLKLRRERLRKKIVFFLLCVCISLVTLVGFLHLPFLTIKEVIVLGSKDEEKALGMFVEQKLASRFYLLFPARSIFLFPYQNALSLEAFPSLASFDTHLQGRSLRVTVTERKPVGLWCTESDVCYFIDSEGMIYAEASHFSQTAFLRFYGTHEGQILGRFLPEADFSRLRTFMDDLRTLDLRPLSLTKKNEHDWSVAVEGRGAPASILFSYPDDLSVTLQKLKTLLAETELKTLHKGGTLSGVDYIDIRYGNKIFYKLSK